MKVLYRFTDSINGKNRPEWFNKTKLLKQFLQRFKNDEIFVFADNIGVDTYEYLRSVIKDPDDHLIITYLGNSKSFIYVAQFALDNFSDDDEIIYFAEDDYLYRENAAQILVEGVRDIGADYVTGYDHPDKYISRAKGGDNPELDDDGEKTTVYLSASSHWKITNSTTMTFATKLRTLREDFSIMCAHCQGGTPSDYAMFVTLRRDKGRKICSSIPGCSTHCETAYLAPLIGWGDML
jgi:glycosyltransferase involved in cell wall biosynthesis